jgi:hypothetical protein
LGGDVGAEVGSFAGSGLGGEGGVIDGFSDDGLVGEVIGAAVGSGLGGEVGVTVSDLGSAEKSVSLCTILST